VAISRKYKTNQY